MLSGIAILAIAFFSIAIDYAFFRQKQDKRLFDLYQIRDKLALKAMENPEIQDDDEYICLNRMICREIMLLRDNIPIIQIIKNYKKSSESEQQYCDEIIKKIEKSDFYMEIYKESSKIFDEQVDKHIKWFSFFILAPLIFISDLFIKLLNRENAPAKEIREKKKKIYKVKNVVEIVPNAYRQYARL